MWERSTRNLLKRKFKLYGDYKSKYKWGEYKSLKEHVQLFKPLKWKINTEWYKFFTLIRQMECPEYLPEDIWHVCLEPVLNQRAYAKAFNDKNLFDKTEYRQFFPKTFLHIIRGVYYSSDYQQISVDEAEKTLKTVKTFVAKKTIDSGGGKGVAFYNIKDIESINDIVKRHGYDVIIQETVEQHSWFERFNPDSVNTIRVVTYRSVIDEKVHVLQTLLRMGKIGSKVDNQSSGGIACGIDKNGRVNGWGCDKLSNKFTKIGDIVFSEVGVIPDFEKLKKTCIDIAKRRFHERVLVFDTWRDVDNNIRLLEINNINIGIEDLQKNNGSMFGKYTKEVVDWCARHSRSYCFDFER